MKSLALALLFVLAACATLPDHRAVRTESVDLWDARRDRRIPVALHFPARQRDCIRTRPCPVALVSPGYGLPHTGYSFIARSLAPSGYLVVVIQHDLPTDPALSRTGDLFVNRMPAWKRGAENLRFVRDTLARTYAGYDWSHLVLIGHSNGGDLSALAVHESPALATKLVTLDHRRHPLPRDASISVLSIRGSDLEADPGVLPTKRDQSPGTCIAEIAGSRHNDMHDQGPRELQAKIGRLLREFLEGGRCGA